MKAAFSGLSAFFLAVVFAHSAAAQQSYCREFTREVDVGGQMQEAYGTACQQADGSWQIMSDSHMGQGTEQPAAQNTPQQSSRSSVVVVNPNQPDVIIVRPSRTYEAQSYGYGYSVGAGTGGTSLTIGTYPMYGYYHPHHRYRWGNDYRRDSFYRHHHGPGWQKHWKHHERSLGRH